MTARPFRLGLTGSIGMGKSTTAEFFRMAGVPVWDADAAVHRLYSAGGQGARAMAELAPDAVDENGVDRTALRARIHTDPGLLPRIEAAIHPLVQADRREFLSRATSDIVLLDIPLLFETGSEADLDAVLVVTAPPDVQRARVLARPGMTDQTLAAILARLLPDSEKRRRADHVIDTSHGLERARDDVQSLLRRLRGRLRDRPDA